MNVPGGGKNDIPNRLKRQFAIFHAPPPSTAALNNIFGALVQVMAPADCCMKPWLHAPARPSCSSLLQPESYGLPSLLFACSSCLHVECPTVMHGNQS